MDLTKPPLKKAFLTILKVCVSALALYWVFRKISLQQITEILKQINWFFLLISLLFLNLSQVASTIRLKSLLSDIGIEINFWQNLRLYYKGMFFNLFLPGGIGGDGLKAYILNRQYRKPLKKIISCLILDRLSGLTGLVFLGGMCFLFSNYYPPAEWMTWLIIPMILLAYPVFYVVIRIFFKSHSNSFVRVSSLGMLVNLVQTVSVITLFLSLGLQSLFIDYISVFYFATAAMVFPFTIGGIGIRELVFVIAPGYLPVNAQTGVTFCLIFFVMNAISSFSGLFVKTEAPSQIEPKTAVLYRE